MAYIVSNPRTIGQPYHDSIRFRSKVRKGSFPTLIRLGISQEANSFLFRCPLVGWRPMLDMDVVIVLCCHRDLCKVFRTRTLEYAMLYLARSSGSSLWPLCTSVNVTLLSLSKRHKHDQSTRTEPDSGATTRI